MNFNSFIVCYLLLLDNGFIRCRSPVKVRCEHQGFKVALVLATMEPQNMPTSSISRRLSQGSHHQQQQQQQQQQQASGQTRVNASADLSALTGPAPGSTAAFYRGQGVQEERGSDDED